MITPELQPDVDLVTVGLFAALNPAVIAVAFAMGRRVDQPAKIIIAGFAGAIAGVGVLWLLAELKFSFVAEAGRAAAGIFVASLFTGSAYAAIGYLTRGRGGR